MSKNLIKKNRLVTLAIVLAAPCALAGTQRAYSAGNIKLAQSEPASTQASEGAQSVAAPRGSEGNVTLTEIVVTATRRSETLSKVPLSVSAMSQAKLDEQGIRSVADLQRTVPGLRFDSVTNTIAIRGIKSAAGASTTGVYIDDTPIQLLNIGYGTANAVPALYDLERIEVLRGPQGTLFGAGAQGGVIRYIAPQPSLTEYSANAKTELGFIKHGSADFQASAAIGGPIVDDKVGFRVSAFYRDIGGWVDHLDYRDYSLAERDFNNGRVYGGRVAFGIAPTEQLLITPSIVIQKRAEYGSNSPNQFHSDPGRGIYRTAAAQPVPVIDDWVLPSLKVEYDFDSFALISNTSYFDRDQTGGYSAIEYMAHIFDTVPGLLTPPVVTAGGVRLPMNYAPVDQTTNKQQNFTQEVRLQSTDTGSPLTWVVGVYYQHNKGFNNDVISDPQIDQMTQLLYGWTGQEFFGSALPLLDGTDTWRSPTHTLDEQIAGFGQIDYNLTDRLKLTAGLRYSKNKFSFDNLSTGMFNVVPVFDEGKQEESPVTPKVGVSFQATDDHLFYATYAEGYRIGGVNAFIPYEPCAVGFTQLGITSAPKTYKSDTTQSYEIGSKNNLFDGRLQLASSVYFTKWDGIQGATSVPVCGYRFIDNQGEAESKGFDLQAQAQLFDGLTVELALGYTDANYSADIIKAGRVIAKDGTSLGQPEWTMALGAQYDFTALGLDSFVRADWQHAAEQKGLTREQDPLIPRTYDATIPKPPATDYVTMRLGTKLNQVDLSIFVDNLLNSTEILGLSHNSVVAPDYSISTWRPRTISLAAGWRF